MFATDPTPTNLPIDTLVKLRREELLSQGRHNAFVLALECQGDICRLQEEIQDVEETIANPPEHLKRPMMPNASPRVYKDGYLSGLKDALNILLQAAEPQPQLAAIAEPSAETYEAVDPNNPQSAVEPASSTRDP